MAGWFYSLVPPQVADWQPSVAELPRAELSGDRLTVYNVRNFENRSETDFTPRWETRTYDLPKLAGLDMFFSYWAGTAIAHTIMSWSFADGSQLAISIETRNRQGQSYSAIAGFFRQFPIYYVVADERDVIRLRTNHRAEHVWLYRLRTPDRVPHSLLLDYLESVNHLARRPAWYNALTDNCTTTILRHVRHLNPDTNPWNWRLLLNGYLPELLYKQGRLDASRPFSDLQGVSNIDERAKAAPCEEFSATIRAGVPNPRLKGCSPTRTLVGWAPVRFGGTVIVRCDRSGIFETIQEGYRGHTRFVDEKSADDQRRGQIREGQPTDRQGVMGFVTSRAGSGNASDDAVA